MDFHKRRWINKRKTRAAHRFSFESLEQRAFLSATPAEIDHVGLISSILDNEATTLPSEIVGKVDPEYWEVAEGISLASQQGTRVGQELQSALMALNLPDPSFGGVNASGEIRTVITVRDIKPDTIAALEAAGARFDTWQFEFGGTAIEKKELYAWVPAHLADELAGLSVVTNLSFPVHGIADTGDENTEGDALLQADDVRSILGFDGIGVRVGVISSGVPHRANVQTTADLPATITIDPVRSGAQADDEGTAMLEIVHDIAPGAQLFFSGFRHIGFDPLGNEITEYRAQDMVDSIDWLVAQGVDVIVDDIQFFDEPAFADGIVAQAANNAVAQGVTLVSAAGNRANRHYQGQFSNNGFGFQDFRVAAQIDDILNVNVAPGARVDAWLHWSDALGSSANNYDIWFIDLTTQATLGTRGNAVQDGVGGNDFPLERAFWTNPTQATVQVGIVVQRVAGVDRELEIYVTPAGTMADDDATITDSMFGHKAVTGVITAGAIDAADPGNHTIREFSSRGPATVYTNFATQQTDPRQSLDGAGINGVRTRVGELGFFSFPFFGTSAAAPHIAGIAALLLDINPAFTPAQVSSFLTNTAVDIDAAGYDINAGFGRFNALSAAYNAYTPSAPDLTAASDSGPITLAGYNTDNYTNVRTPTFEGFAPPGSQVWLYRSFVPTPIATATADAVTGAYTLTVPSNLGQNTYEFWVRVAENAAVAEANKSAESLHLPVTIDFQRPRAFIEAITAVDGLLFTPRTTVGITFTNETSGLAESGIFNFTRDDLRLLNNGIPNILPGTQATLTGSNGSWTLDDLEVGGIDAATASPGVYRLSLSDQTPAIQDRAGNLLLSANDSRWSQELTFAKVGQNDVPFKVHMQTINAGQVGAAEISGKVTSGSVTLSANSFSITKKGVGTALIDTITSEYVTDGFKFNANEGTTTFTVNPGTSSVRRWDLVAVATVNINVPTGHHWRQVTVGENGLLTIQAGTMVTGSLMFDQAAAAPLISSGASIVHDSSGTNIPVSFTVGGVTFTGTANGAVHLLHDTSGSAPIIRKFGSGTFTLTAISSKTVAITFVNEEGKTEFQTNVGDPSVAGSVNWNVAVHEMPGSPASSVEFQTAQNLASLEIGDGAVATISTSTSPNFKVLTVGTLSIAQNGTLDVTNNGFVLDYASTLTSAEIAELEMMVRDLVLRGRGSTGFNPTWTGTGITSSTAAAASANSRAVGYAVNGSLPLGQKTSFMGQAVDSSTILVRFTVTCDFNLDGTVNNDDVSIYSTYYKPGLFRPYWAFGDADYSGYINNDDGTLLGPYYGQSV